VYLLCLCYAQSQREARGKLSYALALCVLLKQALANVVVLREHELCFLGDKSRFAGSYFDLYACSCHI
jgi:hypothetical protein